ncbi:hypothetical protein EMIT036CA2_20388 [Chryseobacterium sp. IT-36CA2]
MFRFPDTWLKRNLKNFWSVELAITRKINNINFIQYDKIEYDYTAFY